MNEIEKLKTLLHHWMEHNNEHSDIYKDWADKALAHGSKDLSKTLEKLYHESKKLNTLFEEALKKL